MATGRMTVERGQPQGRAARCGLLPNRLTEEQKQELANAEAILFELADKVTEKGPSR